MRRSAASSPEPLAAEGLPQGGEREGAGSPFLAACGHACVQAAGSSQSKDFRYGSRGDEAAPLWHLCVNE